MPISTDSIVERKSMTRPSTRAAAMTALTLAALLCCTSRAMAQDTPGMENIPATTASQAEAPAIDSGNNAWMLTSSALVLMMTGPGLALFYSGLVRKKNVVAVMMQCVFLMGLMTLIWAVWGYSLAFGGEGAWIGNLDHLFMRGVQADLVDGSPSLPIYDPGGAAIPMLTHMLFQGMFFIITPALICGAFAERMKFSTMVVFMVVWGTVVYCPLCHWVWGGGILAYGSNGAAAGGALDFAGGTVVHISSGVSALICALLIGKRLGFGSEPMPPHNLTYTAIGATLLWVGWFGFNAGSALMADGIAASAFCATHFAAAAGAVAWASAEWARPGQAHTAGRLFRCCGRAGLHHPRLGLRAAIVGNRDGANRWGGLLLRLHGTEIEIPLRRFARRLRRARRRWNPGEPC